ncbi:MAG TPA: hypothetical protein VNA57_12030 [Acidimicrobiales bacterium]|nr:hypothetical protein [Acidimicrobiales bacterium]
MGLAWLAGACAKTTGGPVDEAGGEPGPRQAVDAMLRQRAKALVAGDAEAYLAPMTPEARAVEEPIARGSTAVPLADVSLLMDEADFNDAGTAVTAARLDFIYRYKDLPEDNLFRFRLLYELELRDGAWMVTSSRHDDSKTPLPIWARGPVTVAKSAHFLALHRPGTTRVDESLKLAETARVKLLEGLTLQPEQIHLLLLARDQAEYRDMAGDGAGSSLAQVSYVFRSSAGHPTRAEARQMVVNLAAVLQNPDRKADLGTDHGSELGGSAGRDEGGDELVMPEGLVEKLENELVPAQVFQHELGHLALSRVTRESTTGWVVEGGAMLLADERRVGSWQLGSLFGIYEQLSFAELSPSPNLTNAIAYAYANAAVSYLVETFGEKKFWDFYRDFKEYEPSGSMEAHPLEELRADATHRLLRRIYDMDEKQLDEKTREYIKKAIA